MINRKNLAQIAYALMPSSIELNDSNIYIKCPMGSGYEGFYIDRWSAWCSFSIGIFSRNMTLNYVSYPASIDFENSGLCRSRPEYFFNLLHGEMFVMMPYLGYEKQSPGRHKEMKLKAEKTSTQALNDNFTLLEQIKLDENLTLEHSIYHDQEDLGISNIWAKRLRNPIAETFSEMIRGEENPQKKYKPQRISLHARFKTKQPEPLPLP